MANSGALTQRIEFFREGILEGMREQGVQDSDTAWQSDSEDSTLEETTTSAVSVEGEFLSPSENRESAKDHLGQIRHVTPTPGTSEGSSTSLVQTAQNLFGAFRRRFLR